MGRVITPNSVGKQREQFMRALAYTLRQLGLQQEVDNQTKDIVAFVVLALYSISDTVDQTATAWEKRGYWIKADRFRLDWNWTETSSNKLHQALLQDDWQSIALNAAKVTVHVQNIKLTKRNQLGTPWQGAWNKLQKENYRIQYPDKSQ